MEIRSSVAYFNGKKNLKDTEHSKQPVQKETAVDSFRVKGVKNKQKNSLERPLLKIVFVVVYLKYQPIKCSSSLLAEQLSAFNNTKRCTPYFSMETFLLAVTFTVSTAWAETDPSRNCWNWPWRGVSLPNAEQKRTQRDSAEVEEEMVVQRTSEVGMFVCRDRSSGQTGSCLAPNLSWSRMWRAISVQGLSKDIYFKNTNSAFFGSERN